MTCLSWNPVREHLIAIGTRTGLVLICNINSNDSIENEIALNVKEYPTLYIYSICWGPNVLTEKPKDNDVCFSLKQGFDYLYCVVDYKIAIIDLTTGRILNFKDIADIYLDKQWTDLNWKGDYSLLAIGNKEGSVDIFSNSLLSTGKIQHILTINDAFQSPIESICFHPIVIKTNNRMSSSSNDNVIAVAGTENTIKIYNLANYIQRSKTETEDLPLMINLYDKILEGHTDRVFKLCWSTFKELNLLSSSEDMTVKVWNCTMNKETTDQPLIKTYYGHFNRVLFAKWSLTEPDTVISGGNDSILSIWKVSEQKNEKPKQIEFIESSKIELIEIESTNADDSKSIDKEKKSFSSLYANDNNKKAQDEENNVDNVLKNGKLLKHTIENNRAIYVVEKYNETNEKLTVTYYKSLDNEKENDDKLVSTNDINLLNTNELNDEYLAAANLNKSSIDVNMSNVNLSKNNDLNNAIEINSNDLSNANLNNDIIKLASDNNLNDQANNLDNIDNIEKRKKRKQFKAKNESKAKSLLTLSTKYDNSLTKLEHYKDIDKMIIDFELRKKRDLDKNELLKTNNENETANEIQQVIDLSQQQTFNQQQKRINKENEIRNETFLLYGNNEDMDYLSRNEIKNHLKNDDLESAYLVKFLSNDFKTIIDEAIMSSQLTDSLVAMSASISLDYWQSTTLHYVEQLVRKGRIVMAAGHLLSLFRIGDALDLLVKHKLFKEALMVAKTRFTSNNNIYIKAIVHALANDYAKSGNFESEIKCWLSIDYLYEAARVLASRIDSISTEHCVKCCKIAFKHQLEN